MYMILLWSSVHYLQITNYQLPDVAESTSTESKPQKKKSKKGFFSLLEDLMDSPFLASDNPQEAAKKKIQQYFTLDASTADNPVDTVK